LKSIAQLVLLVGPFATLLLSYPFIRFLDSRPLFALTASGTLVIAGLAFIISRDHRLQPAGELRLEEQALFCNATVGGAQSIPWDQLRKALIVDYQERPTALVLWHSRGKLILHEPRLVDATLSDLLVALASAVPDREAFTKHSAREVNRQRRIPVVALWATLALLVVAGLLAWTR
jgi:hypothetical protein